MTHLLFKMALPTARTYQLIEGKLSVMEGENTLQSWTATSGHPPYQCFDDQKTRAKGPIPSCSKVGISSYSVKTKPIDLSYHSAVRSNDYLIDEPNKVCIDGVWRSAFDIHFDAGIQGSCGAIVMNRSEFDSFDKFMQNYRKQGHSSIDLIVEYEASETPILTDQESNLVHSNS
jgi:hypothetical protein